jgi:hypothetical protein
MDSRPIKTDKWKIQGGIVLMLQTRVTLETNQTIENTRYNVPYDNDTNDSIPFLFWLFVIFFSFGILC